MTEPTYEELESLSSEIHKCYCRAYERRFGKPYWTNGDYSKLDEPTKDYDREMAKFIFKVVEELKAELEILKSKRPCLCVMDDSAISIVNGHCPKCGGYFVPEKILSLELQVGKLREAIQRIERDYLEADKVYATASLALSTTHSPKAWEVLREANTEFEPALEEMRLILKEDGGCDHSVGICWCEYTRKLERAEEALTKIKEILN